MSFSPLPSPPLPFLLLLLLLLLFLLPPSSRFTDLAEGASATGQDASGVDHRIATGNLSACVCPYMNVRVGEYFGVLRDP